MLLFALLTGCCVWYLHGGARALVLVLLLAAAAYAWREPSVVVRKLRIDAYGRVWLYVAGRRKPLAVTLASGSFIHVYGCFLCWRTEKGRRIDQMVLPDMLSRDDFRKLRVWARFGQEKIRPRRPQADTSSAG